MQIRVVAPKTSLTSRELTVTDWHKREGDPVARGELLVTLEAEKSTVEVPSPVEGIVSSILAASGSTVLVGEVLCVVDDAAHDG